jgi:hypothetical protein
MKKILLTIALGLSLWSCKSSKSEAEYLPKVSDPNFYHACVEKLTAVMIHDIFTPPVASRIYSYANLAAYEAALPGNKQLKSMVGRVNGFQAVPQPEANETYCYPLASLKAFMTVANNLTFSVDKYIEFEKDLYARFEAAGVPSDVIDRSMAHGEAVGNAINEYAKSDKYPQTRGLRYSILNKPGTWVPTPPAYADAVEPNWRQIRSMAMDSAAQFRPVPPPAYSEDANSVFMKEVKEVFEKGNTLTEDEKNIAWFWDDNAFVMNVQGHVMFADKKMTPGGHWMAITRTVATLQKADFYKTVQAYTLVSFALRDAFISCWDEKYRSNKIRPETVINASLDPKWAPFLQTPPFPEYTSGHSTISAASASVLTALFGDNVAFTDSTEFKFGHGVRSFTSFKQAAEECSISRLYGGIHFRSGCEEGVKAGYKIGDNILNKLK